VSGPTAGEAGVNTASASAASSCPNIDQVLLTSCGASTCHNGVDKAGALDLLSPGVGARLVGVQGLAGGLLVDPANPTQSVMVQRLAPTAAGRMPPAEPFDDGQRACFLSWIEGLIAAEEGPAATPTGAAALTAFDIFATAGGRDIAVDRTFPVNVTTGKVHIDFQPGAAQQPKVDAILIAPASH